MSVITSWLNAISFTRSSRMACSRISRPLRIASGLPALAAEDADGAGVSGAPLPAPFQLLPDGVGSGLRKSFLTYIS